MSCMDNSLLKYSAKDHFFRGAICHLCVDTLNAQHALQKYEELFPAFTDSRECKLLKVCTLSWYFAKCSECIHECAGQSETNNEK